MAKMLSKLRSQWREDAAPLPTQLGPGPKVSSIVQDQIQAFDHMLEDGKEQYLTKIICRTFSGVEIMAPHPHGIPVMNETLLTQAEFVLRLNQQVLLKYGFSDDVAGLVQLHNLVMQELDKPYVSELVARYYYYIFFGDNNRIEMPYEKMLSEMSTANQCWMGLLANAQPVMCGCMSYLHHLALPPLERRRRSFARTIAVAEGLLSTKLMFQKRIKPTKQQQKGKEKHSRVVWIFNATDQTLGAMARDGLFEDAAAFTSSSQKMTIYLVTNDNEQLTGSWPCGKNVKVHWLPMQNWDSVPSPELVFWFNTPFSPRSDDRELLLFGHFLLNGCSEYKPIVVVTVRCEAEARESRTVFEAMGAQSAWDWAKKEDMFVRNLYSGMAGNPDIEYDDNGWMVALYETNCPNQVVHWLSEPPALHQVLDFHEKVNGSPCVWTEYGVATIAAGKDGLDLERLGPGCAVGAEFTDFHLAGIRDFHPGVSHMELVWGGFIELSKSKANGWSEGEPAEAQPPQGAENEVQATNGGPEEEQEFRVIHSRVMIRADPSTKASAVGVHSQGDFVRGVPVDIAGEKWLRTSVPAKTRTGAKANSDQAGEMRQAWMLIDGSSIGLSLLLERVRPVPEATVSAPESKENEAEANRDAKESRPKSPAVFWGILDLKYDPRKGLEDEVKVLETGDGRASRFSGYGAAIKESFQQEHKLEDSIRRQVLTENKKFTHDVIVESGYGHVRPKQMAFRKEYTDNLSNEIVEAFHLKEDDVCVLKLCNRARGAGVIPVPVSELDQVLQRLLEPPDDIEAWLREQPEDWARSVVWGSFEEQVRHWWSNESPCFLVEEFCQSISVEKDNAEFDGTMRVGFSLHREYRNKLPRGWVDSPSGPVRVRAPRILEDGKAEEEMEYPVDDGPPPPPWNDDRPYLDLFRRETTFLRLQWLGGYWKLPIEDVNSKNLRNRIVSVAKQGTQPVPDMDLHKVFAGLGDMVSFLFGNHQMSQSDIKERYKHFPELGSFLVARLATSLRMRDKVKGAHMLEIAQRNVEKQKGRCKDTVESYILRNRGVAEAGHSQWLHAAEHFKKSIQMLPANANARHLLGVHFLEQGENREAARAFQETLLLDPDFKAPYACLGVARLRLGQYAAAADVSEAGLIRHPFTVQCQYNLGIACFAQAVLQERTRGIGYLALELRKRSLEALEAVKDQKTQLWEVSHDAILMQLRDSSSPLVCDEKKLPHDGWRIAGWRP